MGLVNHDKTAYNQLVQLKGLDSEEVKTYLANNPLIAKEIKESNEKREKGLLDNNASDGLVNGAGITSEKEGNNAKTPLLNTDANNPVVEAATTNVTDQLYQNQKENPNFLTSFQKKLSSFTDMFKKDPKKSIVSDDYIPTAGNKVFDKNIAKPEFSFGKEQTLG